MIEFFKHLFLHLSDVKGLIEWGGIALVCLIVYVETGLFFGFFLPGDSLLVMAGVFAAAGQMDLTSLLTLVTLCAIVGDQTGYFIGRQAGQNLYKREDSRFFKKRHLEQAHNFYEKYGGKTIIIARFLPIIRTFCAPVAGAARMNYARYLIYDIVGGICWVWSMVLLGYTLGRTVPNIDSKIHWIILFIIVVSLVPAAHQAWKAHTRKPVLPLEGSTPGKD